MANIVIFGATSAIATECAKLFVQRGDHIFLIARNAERLAVLESDLQVRAGSDQRIGYAVADLNQHELHQQLYTKASECLGKIDTVLVAHGSLPDQGACEQSVELTLNELNTNALSAISILTIGANLLAAQGYGALVAISSVAGDRGRQSNYVYGAAKGMLTLFMQGLRNRLAKCGVQVLTVKPGFVDTPMTQAFDKGGLLWAQPEQVAKGILTALSKGKDEVYLLWFWRWIMLIIKLIPEWLFKKLTL